MAFCEQLESRLLMLRSAAAFKDLLDEEHARCDREEVTTNGHLTRSEGHNMEMLQFPRS